MVLSYGMKTIRKRNTGNVACAPLVHYEHGLKVPRRPLALHSLCQQLGVDLGDCDKLVRLNIAPWEKPNVHVKYDTLPRPKSMTPKEEVHQHFRALLASHQNSHHLYTDGSKVNECVSVSVWSDECALRYRLPNHTSVFTSELFAIDKAIDYALNSQHNSFTIFSDSISALQAIESLRTDTNEIQGSIINKLHTSHKSISLVWVPGHCNIRGNE